MMSLGSSHQPYHHVIITVTTQVPLTRLLSLSLPAMPPCLPSSCFKLCCFWDSSSRIWTQAPLTATRRWAPGRGAEEFGIDPGGDQSRGGPSITSVSKHVLSTYFMSAPRQGQESWKEMVLLTYWRKKCRSRQIDTEWRYFKGSGIQQKARKWSKCLDHPHRPKNMLQCPYL